jgi:phosphoribosyl 1,2-cyclic phosphate phosphodiesterase
MKLQILGSGTSTGVPEIGCNCAVCTSSDIRDKRLRTSALLHTDTEHILIDCGPDFREQMLRLDTFHKLDAVLLTHEHYDHVGGIDDLRPFCKFGEIPVVADNYAATHLKERMPYCFGENLYPGVPRIYLQVATPGDAFKIGETTILPIQVMHGKLPILGYRIGALGYVTDMTDMPEESYRMLDGVEVLVINALRTEPHPTHQSIREAIETAKRIGAKETYFIHMSHHAGLHAEATKLLPPHIHFAFDGLEITI